MPSGTLDRNEKALSFFDEAQRQAILKYSSALKDVTTDLAGQGSKIAPILHGFLRASITDYPIEFGLVGGRFIMHGSVAALQNYAEIQHERVDFNHPKGGQDHYLTRPLKERKAQYRDILAKALSDAMRAAKGKL